MNLLKYCLCALIFMFSTLLSAQSFEGTWTGKVGNLPLVFTITEDGGTFTTTMQSPKQSKAHFPMDATRIQGDSINLSFKAYSITFKGLLKEERIDGMFYQGPNSSPLVLEKKAYVAEKPNRPQEPQPPFDYRVEEVSFTNFEADNIVLAGTLSLPPDVEQPPVAILITGSGPQNRDEELLGHKPFLVMADHLTRHGIAVLRYDDRGVGASTGSQDGATSADFATDVAAAIDYLKTRDDIDADKIGLIGHSEGGLIAPIVMAARPDDVAFFVSLAGTGIRGDRILLPQMSKGAQLLGQSGPALEAELQIMDQMFQKILASQNQDQETLQKELEKMITEKVAKMPEDVAASFTDDKIAVLTNMFSSPWMRYFLTYDPASNLSRIQVPVLAINGSLDYQVIPDDNLPGFRAAFAKANNKDVTIKELPGLNHLFQEAKTGSSAEYEQIEQTISPKVLELVSNWINQRF